MKFEKAFIPYGGYWSSPFCRWQGSFGHLHAVKFAAEVAVGALAERKISPDVFDGLFLGWTVPQQFQLSSSTSSMPSASAAAKAEAS